MLYKDCYETTMGQTEPIDSIKHHLNVCFIQNPLSEVSLGFGSCNGVYPVFLTGLFDTEQQVPFFSHPVPFSYKGIDYLVNDARLCMNAKGAEMSELADTVKNRVEYNFVRGRAVLSAMWQAGEVDTIRARLRFAGEVFASFLSQAVSRAYALMASEQLQIQVACLYWWASLHEKDTQFDEHTKQDWAVHIIKSTRARSDEVTSVLSMMPKMGRIDDLAKAIEIAAQNQRLQDFSTPELLTLLKNAWYGNNAQRIISVAIEHPPTWCAMVFACLQERTYKNSLLTKSAEMLGRRGVAENYVNNYLDIMNIHKSEVGVECAVVPDFE